MKGPVVNNAFNSGMRAIDYNHVCVVSVCDNSITVYRESMHNSKYEQRETFAFTRPLHELLEMTDFIKFHMGIAIEKKLYTQEQMQLHMFAVEKLEAEIKTREVVESQMSEFILLRLIKDREDELHYLKRQLEKLRVSRAN